ncbi:hypothetical protein KUTeg_002667 [Tegillarca granosa]|uniref:Receptor ligand binding region domain-containing protein n=1 Tax=Tegillarca granosa TaxID=220873 RepID=A0ABQ9FV21_TEGGR|nr:hypothetical protein KUTeg_002667 [Tegillarca granosa]
MFVRYQADTISQVWSASAFYNGNKSFTRFKVVLKTCAMWIHVCFIFNLFCGIATSPLYANITGDVVIGGLVPVHFASGEDKCGKIQVQDGIQFLEAMAYSVRQINRERVLPGFTLGMITMDTCASDSIALEKTLEFVKSKVNDVSDVSEHHEDFICHDGTLPLNMNNVTDSIHEKLKQVVGIIGPAHSKVSIQVASFLRLFKLPQISYASTSPELSNRDRFSFFKRTVPSDEYQARVVVEILRFSLAKRIFKATYRLNAQKKIIWVGTDSWSGRKFDDNNIHQVVEGSITVQPLARKLAGFDEYFTGLNLEKNKWNPWFAEFWESYFNCNMHTTNKIENIEEKTIECDQSNKISKDNGYKQLPALYFVADAVNAFVYALKNIHRDFCGNNQGLCKNMSRAIDSLGYNFTFINGTDGPPRYSILTYTKTAGEYDWKEIGTYTASTFTLNQNGSSTNPKMSTQPVFSTMSTMSTLSITDIDIGLRNFRALRQFSTESGPFKPGSGFSSETSSLSRSLPNLVDHDYHSTVISKIQANFNRLESVPELFNEGVSSPRGDNINADITDHCKCNDSVDCDVSEHFKFITEPRMCISHTTGDIEDEACNNHVDSDIDNRDTCNNHMNGDIAEHFTCNNHEDRDITKYDNCNDHVNCNIVQNHSCNNNKDRDICEHETCNDQEKLEICNLRL